MFFRSDPLINKTVCIKVLFSYNEISYISELDYILTNAEELFVGDLLSSLSEKCWLAILKSELNLSSEIKVSVKLSENFQSPNFTFCM